MFGMMDCPHRKTNGTVFFPRLAVQGRQKQKGYPPEVSQFAPEKLPRPNRKVGFQPPFSRGHVKVWEGIFHNLNRFVLWNGESLWFTRFLYWKNMVFFFNSQPWQPRTNPTTSNLEGSSTAPPYFWVLKWVPPTSSKVNFFKEFSPSIWRKLPTSFFRQEFLIFPRYRGGHFFGCSDIKDRGWKNIFDSAIRIAIKMGRSPVKSWGFPVKGRILGPESRSNRFWVEVCPCFFGTVEAWWVSHWVTPDYLVGIEVFPGSLELFIHFGFNKCHQWFDGGAVSQMAASRSITWLRFMAAMGPGVMMNGERRTFWSGIAALNK